MPQPILTESSNTTKQVVARSETHPVSTRSFQGGINPILQLQRTLGNHRVGQLIKAGRLTPDGKIMGLQPKLTVGAADDQYEREADRVARKVVSMPDSATTLTFQRKAIIGDDGSKAASPTLQTKPLLLAAPITPLVQRQPETAEIEKNKDKEDESKLLPARLFNKSFEPPLQRLTSTDEEEPDQVQKTVSIQREMSPGGDEKEQILHTMPLAAPLRTFMHRQAENDEEPKDQGKPIHAQCLPATCSDPLWRQPSKEEEEPEANQPKSAGSLSDSFEAGDDVESRLSQSKGSGSQLPDAVRTYMEPRFGVDFSHVRIHTGSNSQQMNQTIGAQAFTHGADVYYGAGSSPTNLELTAHELTHVVQQTGGVPLQAKRLNESPSTNIDLSIQTTCAACSTNSKEEIVSDPVLQRKPTAVTVYLADPAPPVHATERATPENQQLAKDIDALDKLKDDVLIKLRSEAAIGASGPDGNDQQRHLQTLKAIEFLARRRGIAPLTPDYSKEHRNRPPTRRLNVRVLIEEGIRKTGSFKKALGAFTHTKEVESDIEFYNTEAERFATEFRSQAKVTAGHMLEGSLNAISKTLHSYGLPFDSARMAAQRIYHGSDVNDEAEHVVKAAAKSDDVDAPDKVKHRLRLAQWVGRLKMHQQTVADLLKHSNLAGTKRPTGGEGPDWDTANKADVALAAGRNKLKVAWIQAERAHPILAAYRRDGDLEKIDLGTLDTDPVEAQMKGLLLQLLPKIVDIGRARSLVMSKGNFALALPSVVALTRSNMFIPEGSIRAGVVNDLAAAASEDNSGWVQLATFALAIVTLIPGGASVAIPAGMALAAYSSAKEWKKYGTQKTLVNTDIDLARSLSADEPSLTAFAVSLISLGLEGLPLIAAFDKARKIKGLVNMGKIGEEETALLVKELNATGLSRGEGDLLGNQALQDIRAEQRRAFGGGNRGGGGANYGRGGGGSGSGPDPNIVSPVFRFKERDIVIVDTSQGRQAFYRSSGKNSGNPGKWYPFDEITPLPSQKNWFNKAEYTKGPLRHTDHPLHRVGTPEFSSISEGLGRMDIPSGEPLENGRHVNDIIDFFKGRTTPHNRVRPSIE